MTFLFALYVGPIKLILFMKFKLHKQIVNRRTYLRRLTSKGILACAKRFSEIISRAKTEITVPKDRITNLNSVVGYKTPLLKNSKKMWGEKFYVVNFLLNQSNQPASSSKLNGESPKGTILQECSEFGISRNVKAWGRRRIHSTASIRGKGSSKFSILDIWFEGQVIENHFKKLQNNLNRGLKVNNLTAILSDKDFLFSCYQKKRSSPVKIVSCLDMKKLNSLSLNYLIEIGETFRNGFFNFKSLKKSYILKRNSKKQLSAVHIIKDDIVQVGVCLLLNCIIEQTFFNNFYSYAFKAKKSRHAALNHVQTKFRNVNWFIRLDMEFLSIEPSFLIELLREKISDEPFIDLIYKYLKVYYRKVKCNACDVSTEALIYSILFNLYIDHFDSWVINNLIPKYMDKKKGQLEHQNLAKNENFGRSNYVRYKNNCLIGVFCSKKTCKKIQSDIIKFLKEKLTVILHKIKHAFTDCTLFLGHNVRCTYRVLTKKVKLDCLLDRFNHNVVRIVLTVPIKRVVQFLQKKGFFNSKGLPIRHCKYINSEVWSIIDYFKSLEQGITYYYTMANNFVRLVFVVHYCLKYSCSLTLCAKMKFRTVRSAFKKYGKNLTINYKSSLISYKRSKILR